MTALHTFASGSSGNAMLLSWEGGHILVDAGISCRRIRQGLQSLGLDLSELDAICVTHTHSDHISGLQTLLKHTDCPVYAAAPAGRGTLRRTLHDRVPGPAGGAFALPLGGLVAAFCTVEKCFGFHRKLLDKIGWGFYNIRRRTLSLVPAGRRPTLQVYSLKLPLLYFYRWGAVISLYSCPKKQPQSRT